MISRIDREGPREDSVRATHESHHPAIDLALTGWTGVAFAALILSAPQFAYVAGCYGRMIPPRPTDSPACLAVQPPSLHGAAGAVIVIGYILIVAYASAMLARALTARE